MQLKPTISFDGPNHVFLSEYHLEDLPPFKTGPRFNREFGHGDLPDIQTIEDFLGSAGHVAIAGYPNHKRP